MPVRYVSGDPLLTGAQTLAFGHNARARTEVGVLETRLLNLFPAAFATFRKQCQGGRIKPGGLWGWRECQPHLLFMVVRETSVGATRVRFVESAMMTVARDHSLYGLTSLAIAPLGDGAEWTALKPVMDYWLGQCELEVVVYERYEAEVLGE
jgi:hypothetical protein